MPAPEFRSSFFYPSVDLGLGYTLDFSNDQFFRIGVSLQDVNRPNVSFFDDEVLLSSAWIISSNSEVSLGGSFYILPQFRYVTFNNSSNFTGISIFKYRIPNTKTALLVGGGADSKGLYLGQVGVVYKKINLSVLYGNSDELPLNGDVLELSLGFRFK